jgi:hypothetical protein
LIRSLTGQAVLLCLMLKVLTMPHSQLLIEKQVHHASSCCDLALDQRFLLT